MKYIHTRHMGIWVSHYGFLKKKAQNAEFFITSDIEGEHLFFKFELSSFGVFEECVANRQTPYEEELSGEQYICYKEHFDLMKSGEIYSFICNMSFRDHRPDLHEINKSSDITEICAPPVRPHYGHFIVDEEHVGDMDTVIKVLKKLFLQLGFGEEHFEFVEIPSKGEAAESAYLYDNAEVEN